jgi:GNAT superfamily N-acetyltransferase
MQIAYLIEHIDYLPELARLHFEEWSYLRPDETLAERTARLRARCGRRAIPSVVIALEGEELLGSAMLVASDMQTRPELTPWLAGVFVRPGHRGKGIGTRLVERIEEEARALNTAILYLYTESAESLYERLGWRLMERCTYQGVQVVVMSKQLSV